LASTRKTKDLSDSTPQKSCSIIPHTAQIAPKRLQTDPDDDDYVLMSAITAITAINRSPDLN
jgi:hypothetical protein